MSSQSHSHSHGPHDHEAPRGTAAPDARGEPHQRGTFEPGELPAPPTAVSQADGDA